MNDCHDVSQSKSDEGITSKPQYLECSEEVEHNNKSETNDNNKDYLSENSSEEMIYSISSKLNDGFKDDSIEEN